MSHYQQVKVETYLGMNTTSSGGVRVRPIEGQGFSESMNVSCSTEMRKLHPVGTKFLIEAKVTNREGGPDFLYSPPSYGYTVLPD